MAEFDAGQAQSVIEQIKGKQWHQTHKGHKLPAFGFHAFLNGFQAATGFALHPVRGQIAGGNKGQDGANGGGGEIVKGTPVGAEQGAASQSQHRTGKEKYRADDINQHKQ